MTENKKNTAVKSVFIVLLAVALIIRIIHIFTFIDTETGFFKDFTSFSVYLFYGLTVVGSVGLIISERVLSKPAEMLKGRKINIITAVGLVILGAVLIFDCTSDFSNLISAIRTYGMSFKAVSSELGGAVYMLLPIFQILSAAVFILHAISAAANLHFENKINIANLFPVFWALFEVLKCFTVTASYIKQSELFIQIFAYTTAMIAFLGYARFTAGIGLRESGFYFIPCSVISMVFCIMAIFYAVKTGEYRDNIVFFAMVVFFALLLLSIRLEGKRLASVNEENTEETNTELKK